MKVESLKMAIFASVAHYIFRMRQWNTDTKRATTKCIATALVRAGPDLRGGGGRGPGTPPTEGPPPNPFLVQL